MNMKTTIVCVLIMLASSTAIWAQKFGITFAYSTENVLSVDFFRALEKNRFHFGVAYQSGGQLSTVVEEREANYGLTEIDDGKFFWSIDLGYSRVFLGGVSINPEFSFGTEKQFTNYRDNRFKDNGYSLVTDKGNVVGLGLNLGYKIGSMLEPILGYHTMKGANFGLRVAF